MLLRQDAERRGVLESSNLVGRSHAIEDILDFRNCLEVVGDVKLDGANRVHNGLVAPQVNVVAGGVAGLC